MADYLWLFVLLGGAVILGLALLYGVSRQRQLSRREQNAQDRKVKQMYDKNDRQ